MRFWELTAIFQVGTASWVIQGIEYEYNDFMEAELSDVDTFGDADGYSTFEEADDFIVSAILTSRKLRISEEHNERARARGVISQNPPTTEVPIAVEVGRMIFQSMLEDGTPLDEAQHFADEWDRVRKGE